MEVAAGDGFVVGDEIVIGDLARLFERNTIKAVGLGVRSRRAPSTLITLENALQNDYPAGTAVIKAIAVPTLRATTTLPVVTRRRPTQGVDASAATEVSNNDTGRQFTVLTIIIGAAFFLSEVAILYKPEQEMRYYLH